MCTDKRAVHKCFHVLVKSYTNVIHKSIHKIHKNVNNHAGLYVFYYSIKGEKRERKKEIKSDGIVIP